MNPQENSGEVTRRVFIKRTTGTVLAVSAIGISPAYGGFTAGTNGAPDECTYTVSGTEVKASCRNEMTTNSGCIIGGTYDTMQACRLFTTNDHPGSDNSLDECAVEWGKVQKDEMGNPAPVTPGPNSGYGYNAHIPSVHGYCML